MLGCIGRVLALAGVFVVGAVGAANAASWVRHAEGGFINAQNGVGFTGVFLACGVGQLSVRYVVSKEDIPPRLTSAAAVSLVVKMGDGPEISAAATRESGFGNVWEFEVTGNDALLIGTTIGAAATAEFALSPDGGAAQVPYDVDMNAGRDAVVETLRACKIAVADTQSASPPKADTAVAPAAPATAGDQAREGVWTTFADGSGARHAVVAATTASGRAVLDLVQLSCSEIGIDFSLPEADQPNDIAGLPVLDFDLIRDGVEDQMFRSGIAKRVNGGVASLRVKVPAGDIWIDNLARANREVSIGFGADMNRQFYQTRFSAKGSTDAARYVRGGC